MNTNTSDKINLSDLALLVALELTDKTHLWTVKDSDDSHRAQIKRGDGLAITFLQGGGWAPVGKIHVTFSRPRDAKNGYIEIYGDALNGGPINQRVIDPSINVSASKSPEQIAGDIARRLLPDAEKLFTMVNEKINHQNSVVNARNALLREMCQAAGVEMRKPHGHELHDYSFDLGANESVGAEVYVNYGGSVQIKLPSLTPDKAKELINFLQSNTFAPVSAESAS